MATVGAVYTVDPKVRTAEEVVAALFRDGPAKPSGNEPPVAQHKRIWSSLTTEREGVTYRGQDEVFAWLAEEQARRNPSGDKAVVCLMDGQPSRWEDRKTYLPMSPVVEILDLLHVTPRLWEAAPLFRNRSRASARVGSRWTGSPMILA